MDFFNKYFKGKNISNLTDDGLDITEKKEKEIIKKYEEIFTPFIKAMLRLTYVKKTTKTKFIPEKLKKTLIYNFITLINENSESRINLVKYSLNAAIEDNRYVTYMISFYSEFEENHIRPFNIFIIFIFEKGTDDYKYLDIRSNIAFIKILGSKPASDISFGTDYELLKGKMVNIFKDKPLKLILNQSRINNYLNKRENVTTDKYEKGIPLKPFETIEPLLSNPKDEIKIQIGNECISEQNNKLIMTNCENAKKYKYDKLNIKNKDNLCLSYHNEKDLTFIPCNIKSVCKVNNEINNCKDFKFRKYGSLEIDELDLCLDEDLSIGDCKKTKNLKFIK